ncbi:MAG: carboxypeptidase-like regulatory domain-containing protein [Chloroflexota bacterium]
MRTVLIILSIVSATVGAGCKKELITGSVRGIITSYDQYNYTAADQSGVEITFFRDSVPAGTATTDTQGRYSMDDLEYGNYMVEYRKDGYIMSYEKRGFKHVGGGAPYYSNFGLYEVPGFSIHLDSIGLFRDYYFYIHLKIDGDTVLKSKYQSSSYFIAFVSDSPDVSKVNYRSRGKGYFTAWLSFPYNIPVPVCGIIGDIEDIDYRLSSFDSIYMVVYPLSGGQGYNFDQYLDGALGQPSNVLKCKLPDR